MTVSYPGEVWNGDTDNRDMSLAQKKAPDWRDWRRLVEELAAAQTQIDSYNVGVDATAIDSIGAVTTKTGLTVVEKGSIVRNPFWTLISISVEAKFSPI